MKVVMKTKVNIIIPIQYDNFEEISSPESRQIDNFTSVYILTKDSFLNYPNIDILGIINNNHSLSQEQLMLLKTSKIRIIYPYQEVISFREKQIDFYIMDRIRLLNILSNIGIHLQNLFQSNIFYLEQKKLKMIYFSKETKFLSIKDNYQRLVINPIKKVNNQINMINPTNKYNISQMAINQNNDNLLIKEQKGNIIRSLIFLCVNEKEIMNYYNQGIFHLKNYYLVNKAWIDKYKELYHYDEICNISHIKRIKTLKDCMIYLNFLETTNEIQSFYNKISIQTFELFPFNLSPEIKNSVINGEYKYPINFTIIHGSILEILIHFTNYNSISEYQISFGKSSFYLRWTNFNELGKIYIYDYNNLSFHIFSIIHIFADIWKYIYDKYLKNSTFTNYLKKKQINFNLINQAQNLVSEGNKHLGYVYLLSQIIENYNERIRNNRFDNLNLNENRRSGYRTPVDRSIRIDEDNINFKINIVKIKPVNNNISFDNEKTKIIQSLILLYGNEKDILIYYSNGVLDLKDYCLVNKPWLDKFKEIYHYNEIYDSLSNNGIGSFNECLQNLKFLQTIHSIQSLYYKINKDTHTLSQFNLPINKMTKGESGEYQVPVNFTIIHSKIYYLLKSYSNLIFNAEYEINFGKSSLYLRLKCELNKIYVYNYINTSFNLLGIIDFLTADWWKVIYDRHFCKKKFEQYLTDKQINLNIRNQKQNLFSSLNSQQGYIYLTSEMEANNGDNQSMEVNRILTINEKINNDLDYDTIYKRLINSINTLRHNNLDLPDIQSILNNLSTNSLINLPVFIIEKQKRDYCSDNINQFKDCLNDFSYCISEIDIVPGDKTSELTRYSFFNEEMLTFFKISNINNLPKAILFVDRIKTYILYPNQNILLKLFNYCNNEFNLKPLSVSIPQQKELMPMIPPNPSQLKFQEKKSHALGLENIGATCYMNATLQC